MLARSGERSWTSRLVRALLTLTREDGATMLDGVAERARAPRAKVRENLAELCVKGLVAFDGDHIAVTPQQRVRLALEAILYGADPEQISSKLRWQEFEELALEALRANGYRVVKHLVFKVNGRRKEIDVLGIREPIIVCVDCKHWSHGWHPKRIRHAIEAQLARVAALGQDPLTIRSKLGIDGSERLYLLPAVLSLADVQRRLVEGVPVVSVLRFSSFLRELSPLVPGLRFIRRSLEEREPPSNV